MPKHLHFHIFWQNEAPSHRDSEKNMLNRIWNVTLACRFRISSDLYWPSLATTNECNNGGIRRLTTPTAVSHNHENNNEIIHNFVKIQQAYVMNKWQNVAHNTVFLILFWGVTTALVTSLSEEPRLRSRWVDKMHNKLYFGFWWFF